MSDPVILANGEPYVDPCTPTAPGVAEECRETVEAYRAGTLAHDLKDVGRLIKDFYTLPGNGAGGSLHIVLDDGNIGVGSIEFCQRYATEHDDQAGYWLATLLLALTDEEREELLGPTYCGKCGQDLDECLCEGTI